MRIIVLTNLYPPDVLGGYELLAQDIVERLLSRNHAVIVLTSGRGQPVAGQARFLRLARPFDSLARRDRLRHLWAAVHNRRQVAAYLRDHGRPDAALVMSMRRLGVEPLRVLQEASIPFVLTVNDDWPVAYSCAQGEGLRHSVGGWVDRWGGWRHTWRGLTVHRVVYLSDAIRNQVRARVGIFPSGIVCAQGVDHRSFRPREFRPISESPQMLFVGRLHPTKAPDVAIDALAHLRGRNIDAKLAFAGAPVTAAYATELRQRVNRLGLEKHIRWLGLVPRQQLAAVYRGADLTLFLSRWDEPQGLTHMESMACGVPVVAFPQGGARELLDAFPAAARAKSCSGDAVAEAVIELMREPDRQERLVQAGLNLVHHQASLDHYVDVLEEQLALAARA